MAVKWHGDQVLAATKARLSRNLDQAALFAKDVVQRSINRGNPTGESPSAPGEPPKKVSGRLFQSITTDRADIGDKLIGVVGTNVEYARRLELGFVGTDSQGRNINQAPRPFLRPALDENTTAIARILARK